MVDDCSPNIIGEWMLFEELYPKIRKYNTSTSLELSRKALEYGKAAEHLVCYDLIMSGYKAFLADQGCPYDIVIDMDGRLLRVQVKGCLKSKPAPARKCHTPSYSFHTMRAGKKGKRARKADEFELLALVALDIKVIAYIPINNHVCQSIHLRIPGGISKKARTTSRKNIDQYPIDLALESLGK